MVAAGLIFGIGQLLLAVVRPLWLRIAIAPAFVAPASIADYHATHGIVKHAMPSETWQIAFSVVGAIAVGIAAFLRIAAMAAPEPAGQGHGAGLTPTQPTEHGQQVGTPAILATKDGRNWPASRDRNARPDTA
ncbi:hypothetical protein [Aurantimonas sp. C2-3-R2]|uniref:hypothetical protein n=1 Tax=unclassified Aurantimonas TaxID=2638230 RepID=UPI003FA46B31